MDSSKQVPHSRDCTCNLCFSLGQGQHGERLEAEKQILSDLQRIEVYGEMRFYDSAGFWTARSGVMSINW